MWITVSLCNSADFTRYAGIHLNCWILGFALNDFVVDQITIFFVFRNNGSELGETSKGRARSAAFLLQS